MTHRPEDEIDVLEAGAAQFRGRDRGVAAVDRHRRPDPLDHRVGQFAGPLQHPRAQQCNLRVNWVERRMFHEPILACC